MPSESMQTCNDFCTNLAERDVCRVWTGVELAFGTGLICIPYKLGSEVRSISLLLGMISPFLSLSVVSADRRESSKIQRGCDNTLRNGVFANSLIYNGFDPRFAVVLKVCLPACPLQLSDPPYVATDPKSYP
jgi:hypothetical protein